MNEKKKGALGLRINSPLERLMNGIVVENPTLILMIGMCPSLAVTTCGLNGIYMGLATTVVLALSNVVISAIRKIVPDTVRIPLFIVVIASFVTMVDLLMHAYVPAAYKELGVYIPLIVVNCIIFGRAEAYASKNGMFPAFFDGIGMGIGFTIAITMIGLVREILGTGTFFGIPFMGEAAGGPLAGYTPILLFIQPPGAFLVLAFLIAIMNKIKSNLAKKGKKTTQFGEMAAEETAVAKEAEAKKALKETAAKAETAAAGAEKLEAKADAKEASKTDDKENKQSEGSEDSAKDGDSVKAGKEEDK